MASFVIAFDSTHAAIAAQEVLRKPPNGADPVRFSVVSTPAEISAGCGISLSFEAETRINALETLALLHEFYQLASLYERVGGACGSRFELLDGGLIGW